MDLNHTEEPALSEESIDRIRRHIGLLIKVYYQMGDKHVSPENEGDLEDFARLLLAFSAAVGSHLKRKLHNPKGPFMESDATLEELSFYDLGFQQLNR